MKYRPEIDGLRAVAVISVILFHAGVKYFNGGFVGVDVFFVISGFLITSIILNELEKGSFSLLNFYERRARRILPALIIISVVTVPISWVLLNPIQVDQFASSVIGVSTFTANLVFWLGTGYFEESSSLKPLIHTWSLSVEEQYYILFPLFLIYLKCFRRSYYNNIFLLLGFISFAISHWAVSYQSHERIISGAFFLLPTRGWELLLGGLAAVQYSHKQVERTPILSELLTFIGLILIISACIIINENTPYPGLDALLPTFGTFLIIFFGGNGTWVDKILRHKAIVFTGLISYSLYLWHQPIFVFYRYYSGKINFSLYETTFLIIVSFGLSLITWKYVENPFRHRKYLSSKMLFGVSFISLLLLLFMGYITKLAVKDQEFRLAQALTENEYVYFGNIDERKFTLARLALMDKSPKNILMGSSRFMQAGSEILGFDILNLSVSGATIEDYVAILGESTCRFKPENIYISVDPWIYNDTKGQGRWGSIDKTFLYWKDKIDYPNQVKSSSGDSRCVEPDYFQNNFITRMFDFINRTKLIADNGVNGIQNKRANDGSLIYEISKANKTPEQIRNDFINELHYGMGGYKYSSSNEQWLRGLITYLKTLDIGVVLVLIPYHPEMFQLMIDGEYPYQLIETDIKKLAGDLEVNVLGSFNPEEIGCVNSEFFDGMHPKKSCLVKVLNQNSEQDSI